jgi:amidase
VINAPRDDAAGAFVPGERFELPPLSAGPLDGLGFAVKDLFDVAGRRTGGGNPTWRDTHPPAMRHAVVVERLLAAGARAVGKTITDELAYSVVGKNHHYGTPRNGGAPDRMPGGSSSGSAAAVSNGLADFALGTDTGGSVRVPASYCGLFGMRPSHGRVSLEGCMALAPSFDTCGWFTRSAEHLERVGRVLLGPGGAPTALGRIVVAPEIWSAASDEVRRALEPALSRLEAAFGSSASLSLFPSNDAWSELDLHSRNLLAFEAWQTFRDWFAAANPVLGPEIDQRFKAASGVTAQQASEARVARAGFAARIASLLPPGTVLCVPTTPTVAAPRSADPAGLQAVRMKTLQFTCIAGLASLPEATMPVRTSEGLPCGLSFVAASGADEAVLAFLGNAAAALGIKTRGSIA